MEAQNEALQALAHSIHHLAATLSSQSSLLSPVLTGILGFLSGLLVIGIQTYYSNKRAETRIRSDALEARKQRASERRKEVYLKVSERISKLPGSLSSLAYKGSDENYAENDLANLNAILSQVSQIAEGETAKKAIALTGTISSLGLEAIEYLTPITSLEAHRNATQNELALAEAEHRRILSTLISASETKDKDNLNIELLERKSQWWHEATENVRKKLIEKEGELADAKINFLIWNKASVGPAIKEAFALQLLMRQEFELDDDPEDLRITFEEMRASLEDKINKSIHTIEKAIAEEKSKFNTQPSDQN